MKKYFFAVLISFLAMRGMAQKHVIRETFESNKMQWDEFYEKSYTAGVQDGCLLIQNKNDEYLIRSVVDLPINPDRNFKLSFKMTANKVNDNSMFGIIYNFEDENNYSCFLVQEKKFVIFNRLNGVNSMSRGGGIILKSGKNAKVDIVLEKKGKRLVFTVNDMEVISITKSVNNTFGCGVLGENTIKVEELLIEQLPEE